MLAHLSICPSQSLPRRIITDLLSCAGIYFDLEQARKRSDRRRRRCQTFVSVKSFAAIETFSGRCDAAARTSEAERFTRLWDRSKKKRSYDTRQCSFTKLFAHQSNAASPRNAIREAWAMAALEPLPDLSCNDRASSIATINKNAPTI